VEKKEGEFRRNKKTNTQENELCKRNIADLRETLVGKGEIRKFTGKTGFWGGLVWFSFIGKRSSQLTPSGKERLRNAEPGDREERIGNPGRGDEGTVLVT